MFECTDKETVQALLTSARTAYSDIISGRAVREIVDQNGERVAYSAANLPRLLSYIQQLEACLSRLGGKPISSGPARFVF